MRQLLPNECWTHTFQWLNCWELGQLLKTSQHLNECVSAWFPKHRRQVFPIRYDTNYNVAAYNVLKKVLEEVVRKPFRTLSSAVDFLYWNRVYVYHSSFLYIPATEDQNLEGPLYYTMEVWDED